MKGTFHNAKLIEEHVWHNDNKQAISAKIPNSKKRIAKPQAGILYPGVKASIQEHLDVRMLRQTGLDSKGE
jgi:hypothetical protein